MIIARFYQRGRLVETFKYAPAFVGDCSGIERAHSWIDSMFNTFGIGGAVVCCDDTVICHRSRGI